MRGRLEGQSGPGNVQVWHALYAPHGTPAPVVAKLNAALKDPQLVKRWQELGITVVTDDRLGPTGHRKFLEAEIARWGKVIGKSGQFAD